MKKILICLIVLGLGNVGSVYATVDLTEINFPNVQAGNFDQSLRRWVGTLNTDIANAAGLFNLGTGRVFYGDSNAGGSATSTGTSPTTAWPTLDDAYDTGHVTADRGDIVYCLQGHNEDLVGADGVDIDLAGSTVVCLGNGSLRPTFDFETATGAEFVLGAANTIIYNALFRISFEEVVHGVDFEDAADDCALINCEFGQAETSTDEFLSAVSIQSGVKRARIIGCKFKAGGNEANHAIHIVSNAIDVEIRDNFIHGDYAVACIKATEATIDDLFIIDNVLFNGTTGGDGEIMNQPAIEIADGGSGFVADNRIISDVATASAMRVFDDGVFMNNFVTDSDGQTISGTLETLEATSVSPHADG